MHFICTLYAPCTRLVQNFDFLRGTHRRQPMMTRKKSKSCGATAEHFQFNRSAIIGWNSSVGTHRSADRRGKTGKPKGTPPLRGGGWAGGAAGQKWGHCCTAELQRRSSGRKGCHGACGVAALPAVRSRCNGAAQVCPRFVTSA